MPRWGWLNRLACSHWKSVKGSMQINGPSFRRSGLGPGTTAPSPTDQVSVALEGLVGQLAARNMKPAAQAQVRELLGAMQKVGTRGDAVSYASKSLQFHDSRALHTGHLARYETCCKLISPLKLLRSPTFQYRPKPLGFPTRNTRTR